jgi:hypothetical protein
LISLLFPPLLSALWLVAATAADPTIVPPSPDGADGAAVRVVVETVVIDRRGTWSAGSDQADLIPGASGVLKKSVDLTAKDARRTRESIEIEARLGLQAPGAGQACVLQLAVETRPAAAAPAASRPRGRPVGSISASLALAPGEERFVDAYVSAKTGGKVALRVRCDTARHEDDGAGDLVGIDLEVERRVDGESASVIGDQQLTALLGREVAVTVGDHVTLPPADGEEPRFRRERLDLTLAPVVVVAGKLQIEVAVKGEVATVGSEGTPVAHPIEKREVFLVTPLEARTLEIVVPGSAAEGWKDLHYLIQVRTRF